MKTLNFIELEYGKKYIIDNQKGSYPYYRLNKEGFLEIVIGGDDVIEGGTATRIVSPHQNMRFKEINQNQGKHFFIFETDKGSDNEFITRLAQDEYTAFDILAQEMYGANYDQLDFRERQIIDQYLSTLKEDGVVYFEADPAIYYFYCDK